MTSRTWQGGGHTFMRQSTYAQSWKYFMHFLHESGLGPRDRFSSPERLVRNISTELYHVLIMLIREPARRLLLKTAEPEGLEAYRLLLRRYEPASTVTAVSKLVDLLVTTFLW